MKFFNVDLHVAVIEDIKKIFSDLGHEVHSKNFSSHNWVFNREPDVIDVIGQHNWTSLSPKICDEFYERYKDELSDYDGFIVTYPPTFSLLFEKFNKPIIVVAATRYEAPFTNDITKWDQFNDFLRRKIDENMIIPITNNLYDKKYCEGFTDREWTHIPSVCEYTNLKYTGEKQEFILYTKSKSIDHPLITRKESLSDNSWANLYSHKGIIHVPYNVSTMSIFEQKAAGVPLFFPSLKYLQNIKGTLSEMWFGGMPRRLIGGGYLTDEKSLKLSDFYQWKEVLLFDSDEELFRLMDIVDFDSFSRRSMKENEIIKNMAYERWGSVLDYYFVPDITSKLREVLTTKEDGLFDHENAESGNEQLSFLRKHLENIKPNLILETGTHVGFFDLFVSEMFPDINIYTFGMEDYSKQAIEILIKEKNPNIKFFQGDSVETLSSFETTEKINFAWVDGGHSLSVAFSDLMNCDRLKIPHVFVDDSRSERGVVSAIDSFLSKTNYVKIEESNYKDRRGIAYLKNDQYIDQAPEELMPRNEGIKGENITFGVLTSEKDFGKGRGARGILNTWGKELKNIYFATDEENPDERFIKLTSHRDLASNCEKQLKLIIHLVEKYPETEWYALVDDDTFIYADNLIEFLDNKETPMPVCYGYMMSLWPGDKDLVHPSGGAGYILNRHAAKLVSNALQTLKSLKTYPHWKDEFDTIHPDKEVNRTTHPVNCGFGDVTLGLYFRELGVECIHCDKLHSRQPWDIDSQRQQGKDLLQKFRIKQESFDRNISFHTITEQEMYDESWEKIELINNLEEYNKIVS